ncbi:MAG TPA: tyrosine-type recombinase/integrase [Chloroflexota bacterium]|nr:tyrosine-type recombinase/integrase [Chloroflexota bacterium]
MARATKATKGPAGPPGPARPGGMTLQEARAGFLDSLGGKSPHTTRSYNTGLDRFFDFLSEGGADPQTLETGGLPADALERFYVWLVRRYGRTARGTQLTYLAGVRAYFRYLERRRLTPEGLTVERARAGLREVMGRPPAYKTPRVDGRLPEIVTYADAVPLPGGAGPGPARRRLEVLRDRALIRTLYCTGMRRAEAASLDRGDVQDGHAGQALVTGKGEKERVVFFDAETLAAIRAYLQARADGYAPLFLRHDTGRGAPGPAGMRFRITTQTVWNVVRRYARAVGVRASPHAFRHDKASLMLNEGAKLSEVQDILGHASPETTKKIYAHYETAHLRDAFDRYSVSPEARAARRRPGRPPP